MTNLQRCLGKLDIMHGSFMPLSLSVRVGLCERVCGRLLSSPPPRFKKVRNHLPAGVWEYALVFIIWIWHLTALRVVSEGRSLKFWSLLNQPIKDRAPNVAFKSSFRLSQWI